ncbi:MAG: GNAT family N-acetyltransferase [Comamonas sp.]|jgi:ribosomal protein S18 acetylase RimI-like enzyme|nr:GNAT family N-acetyltransferase [Comamonas sp.]
MTNLRISTNKNELNIPLIHHFLSTQTAWAKNIPLPTLKKAIVNSLCFGGFIDNQQIAFARVITDGATFANLVDVFVIPDCRDKGHGKSLMEAVFTHPQLQGLRRFTLATSDAHGLYEKFGFKPPLYPNTYMEIYNPNIYKALNQIN